MSIHDSSPEATLGEPIGVSRVANLLVVDPKTHRFPPRCALTNSTDDVICVDIHRPMLNKNAVWFGMFLLSTIALFAAGQSTFLVSLGNRPPVFIGISREKYASWQAVRFYGMGIYFSGMLILLGSLVGYITCVFVNKMSFANTYIAWGFFPLGLALLIGGAIYRARNEAPLLKLEKTVGNLEWYSGANAEFLETLPFKRENVGLSEFADKND